MSRLGVAVLGAGSIADLHLTSYAADPRVDIVAVLDQDVERAHRVAAAFGAEGTADLDTVLADSRVEAVSICTWNDSHAELAIAALKAGKHVLVEKPLSRTVKEALEVQRAVEASGCVLEVGFVRRFGANATVAKSFIDAGELGDIYYAKASLLRRAGNPGGWFADKARSGGGPLIDIGVHLIDLCWYMMGRPQPVAVSGNSYTALGNRANITNLERYLVADYDPTENTVEDMVNALVRFDNGASMLVDFSYSLHALRDSIGASMFGTKGGVEVEPELMLAAERHDTILNMTPQLDHPTFDMTGGFAAEISGFVSTCLGAAAPMAPVGDGVAVMQMIEGVYESASTGQEVRL